MAQVLLSDIRKTFSGNAVLKGIDLTVGDGEFVTLLGPSGCGKSTLLRIIAGLEDQSEGTVRIGARLVDAVGPADRNIAMVFQSYALYPHMRAFDIMALPLRLSRLHWYERLPLVGRLSGPARERHRRIVEEVNAAADLLGISELLHRRPGEMSGGQRQRVALGRSIVRHPDVFLFDEPLSNLDAKLRNQMRSDLVQLQRRLGATFLYVTHDQTEAMTMSDRMAVMFDGEIEQLGTPAEVYRDPETLRVAQFIGNPAANAVSATVSGGFLHVGEVRVPIAGQAASRQTAARPVRLAFRPEAVRFTSAPGMALTGEVELVEDYGADRCIRLRLPAAPEPVVVRTASRTDVRIGERLGFSLDADDIFLFDMEGRRLRDLVIPPVAAVGMRA